MQDTEVISHPFRYCNIWARRYVRGSLWWSVPTVFKNKFLQPGKEIGFAVGPWTHRKLKFAKAIRSSGKCQSSTYVDMWTLWTAISMPTNFTLFDPFRLVSRLGIKIWGAKVCDILILVSLIQLPLSCRFVTTKITLIWNDLENMVAWKLLDLRYVQQVKLKQLPAFYSDRDPRLATFLGPFFGVPYP